MLKPPFHGPHYVRRAKHVRLVPQPSREDVTRVRRRLLCGGHCDLHGPAHPGSNPRPSPWLRPSANASRPEAPFLRCTRPVGGPTTTTNGNVSHLKESFGRLVSRRRGVTSRTIHPSENQNSAPSFALAVQDTSKHTRHHRKAALWSAPASSRRALLVYCNDCCFSDRFDGVRCL